VQVVHIDHARILANRSSDLLDTQPFGRRFQEDSAGVFEQSIGAAEHQADDNERGDRVGPVETGDEDDHGGDERADEGVEVGDDVLEAALDGHVLAVCLAQLPGGEDVDRNAGERNGQHRPAADRRR
jgi:hypothetical protein